MITKLLANAQGNSLNPKPKPKPQTVNPRPESLDPEATWHCARLANSPASGHAHTHTHTHTHRPANPPSSGCRGREGATHRHDGAGGDLSHTSCLGPYPRTLVPASLLLHKRSAVDMARLNAYHRKNPHLSGCSSY